MKAQVRVWCLRHGESENVTRGVAGALPNARLTKRGHEQAALAAQALTGETLSAVYSSTALRARQTAQPLATAAGVAVQAVPDLVEVGIGACEGSSEPAVRQRTAEVLRAWVVDNDLAQQVADGETGFDVAARMTMAFHAIADQHGGETVAVTGHVASLTVAISRLCSLGATLWGTPLPHAQPFLIEWDGLAWHCRSRPEANGP